MKVMDSLKENWQA